MTEAVAAKCVLCDHGNARVGLCCPDCVNALDRIVREIGDYWTDLKDMTEPPRGNTGRMQPGYGSRSPAADDVLVALDPRSRPGDVDEDGEAILRRPDDTKDWIRSIPGALDGIADWVFTERADWHPPLVLPHLADPVGYIRRQLRWCAQQPWIGDVADDLTEVHGQARSLAHDHPQGPLAACLVVGCEGKVFEGGPGRAAQCERCKRPYMGLDLLRLGAAEETAA